MVDGVKISQLPQLISADVDDTDELVIVDVSEGVSKKITRSKLLGSAFPTVDINGGTIDGTVIGGTTPAAVTGTTITAASFVSSGDMTFGDNDKAIFGAGSDLEIYHSGAQSVIKDVGSGNLYLAGDANVYITDSTLAENKAIFTTNGAASLYYDNAAKLATTSTGISVTGTATASGFTGDLTGDVTGNLTGNVTSTGSSTFSNLDVTTLSIGSTAITATAAELNYVDGVTSNIQTQLDTKLSNITGQSIKNLSDVYSLMAPSDGQILVWDSVNSRWQAEDNTGGGGGGAATLSGVLANSNTTGGYDINVNSGSYITFGDNNKAVFGAGSDLQIYHDGSHSRIDEQGTGVLFLQTNGTNIQLNKGTSENMLVANVDGSVDLYYDNAQKLATTATGVDITGTLTSDGLTVDTNTLYVDSANNRVGIGTSSPTGKLSVSDPTYLSSTATLGSSITLNSENTASWLGTRELISFESVGNGADHRTGTLSIKLKKGNSDTTLTEYMQINAVSNYTTFSTAGSEAMRIDSSGNVGIGTASPDTSGGYTALAINGTTSGWIQLKDDGTTVADWYSSGGTESTFRSLSGGFNFTISGSNPFKFVSNSSERMRVDSSGNLIVGQTSTSAVGIGTGAYIASNGQLYASSTNSHFFNRKSTDGDIAVFRKDNTTVGSISTIAGRLLVESGDTGLYFVNDTDTIVPSGSGVARDNAINLGDQFTRFKDLYLSGGIEIEQGTGNVGVGKQALNSNTASNNTAVGYQAGYSNTTGYNNIAIGYQALYNNTTGYENNATGVVALLSNTAGAFNTAYGNASVRSNTTGNYNTGIGVNALYSNTTASNNTAVGYQAGYANITGTELTFLGYKAGTNTTGSYNTFVGSQTGITNTTGTGNTGVGWGAISSTSGATDNTAIGYGAGSSITTGSKNTIIGRYTGNQGGLDIRTSSNNIVLSDGDGNWRYRIDGSGKAFFPGVWQLDGNGAYFISTASTGYRFNDSANSFNNMVIADNGNVTIRGALSKGSGSFRIPHPLEAKRETNDLVHSFLEAPQADNLYRGKVDLVAGSATVNIDTVAGMTEGTFAALNREVQCFTSNETGWTAVKGSVSGNILTINAQESDCTDTISWMVIGERKDQHMYDTDWTDENGKVIVEPTKRPDKI
jgi:hypothetical protein